MLPLVTLRKSAPASPLDRSAAACAAVSGTSPAQGAYSSPTTRTPRSAFGPIALRTAAITCLAKRARFSRLPPKSSPRRLVNGERNCRSRLDCPTLISTPSSPPSMAHTAARAKAFTRVATSAGSISMGTSRLFTSGIGDGAHSGVCM